MNRSLRLAAPTAALAALAAPAGVHAQTPATLTSQLPCIRFVDTSEKTLPLQGAGFAANALVSIAADGAALDSIQADAAGSFQGAVLAPPLGPDTNRKSVSITADDGQGHIAGPLTLPEVKLGVDLPRHATPRKRVLFRAYGFAPGETIYLHIRRNHKTLGRFSLGKGDSPCGVARKRMRAMPLRHYSVGTYEYWFGNTERYDRSKEIGYQISITVRSRAAAAASSRAGLELVG